MASSQAEPLRVLGLGDPVTDICCDVSHELLQRTGAQPGGCMLVSPAEMQALLDAAATDAPAACVPGGSAANVLKGLAAVSGGALEPQFFGMVGADAAGSHYERELRAHGVQPRLLRCASGAPTAACVCLVTPDGQRTMRTCLGAAAELTVAAQLPPGWAAGRPALLHVEGYALYKPALARDAMAAARAAGATVSLDLASFEVVRGCRGALMELLAEGLVDVVFCNEEEAAALAGAEAAGGSGCGGGLSGVAAADAAAAIVLQHARVCVVSLGARGAVARAAGGEAGSAPAAAVRVVDTIGAGDLFSAGFLFALLRGCPLSTCCAAGCAAGAEAVQARGTGLPAAAWQRLRAAVAALVASGGDAASARGPKIPGVPPRAAGVACPAGRKRGPLGHGLALSPGLERGRVAGASVASSMGSSASTQWLAVMDALADAPA
ncbi:MAG: Ribokinase-like protein [Monoraphidium minutum]|nr:MAG: Ribokinase-like protein [Monoraphidium minutum]